MNLLREAGALALASRFKRLSDKLVQDGIRIYRDNQVEFEPRWFPVYYYLMKSGPSPVTRIARELGISHPAVNQIAKELLARDYVAAYKDTKDKRKRLLALTSKGKAQRPELERLWKQINDSLQDLLDETQVDFLGYLESVERSLGKVSFYNRFQAQTVSSLPGITIARFDESYIEDFRRINRNWILEQFKLEAADKKIFEDPVIRIIKPGGEILFALETATGKVIGTCALIHHTSEVSELAKMGVDKDARGQGIGRLMCDQVLQIATHKGYRKIFLETNTRLATAIGLYKSMGFLRQVSPFKTNYQRVDVYMELMLGRNT